MTTYSNAGFVISNNFIIWEHLNYKGLNGYAFMSNLTMAEPKNFTTEDKEAINAFYNHFANNSLYAEKFAQILKDIKAIKYPRFGRKFTNTEAKAQILYWIYEVNQRKYLTDRQAADLFFRSINASELCYIRFVGICYQIKSL